MVCYFNSIMLHFHCKLVCKYFYNGRIKMVENNNLSYIEQLENLNTKDSRATKTEFYHTFAFDDLYSRSMLIQIMNGNRLPGDRNVYILIENALKIYSENIIDNRPFFDHENGEKSTVMSTYKSICWSYPEFVNPDKFANITNYPGVNYGISLRSKKPTAGGIDAYEAMTLGLLVGFPRNRNDFFANMRDYRRIKNLIMRAQLGNGFDVKSLSDIAKESDVDIADLKHPERLCRDVDRYMESYEKIIKKLPSFNIKQNTKNKRWNRNSVE